MKQKVKICEQAVWDDLVSQAQAQAESARGRGDQLEEEKHQTILATIMNQRSKRVLWERRN